jgi:hypothetical protein
MEAAIDPIFEMFGHRTISAFMQNLPIPGDHDNARKTFRLDHLAKEYFRRDVECFHAFRTGRIFGV